MFYRKDLFEDPLLNQKYEALYGCPLTLPQDWETFNRIARMLLQMKKLLPLFLKHADIASLVF